MNETRVGLPVVTTLVNYSRDPQLSNALWQAGV